MHLHINSGVNESCVKSQARNFYFSRIPEAVLIIMVTTACVFLAATLLGTCVHEKRINKEESLCPGLTVCSTTIILLQWHVFHVFCNSG